MQQPRMDPDMGVLRRLGGCGSDGAILRRTAGAQLRAASRSQGPLGDGAVWGGRVIQLARLAAERVHHHGRERDATVPTLHATHR